MDSPLFSIVIPSYNYARLLPRAIESVLSQQGSDIELLVIDDGSTDNTPQIAQELLEMYPGFRYLRQANRGLSATRNRGIIESTGEYILFLDADDMLCEGALQEVAARIQDARPKLMIGGYYSRWDNGRISKQLGGSLSPTKRKRVEDYLLNKKLVVSPSATLISRVVFSEIDFDEGVCSSEDMPFFAGVLARYDEVELLDFPVAEMARHAESMRNDLVRAEQGVEALEEEWKDRQWCGT